MKTISVLNRLVRGIAAQWFEGLKRPRSSQIGQGFETKSLEEASHDAIIGIYLFRSQVQELISSRKHSAYTNTITALSDTLKGFNNVTINEETDNALMHVSMLSSSVHNSLSRLAELLDTFANEKIDQKKESTTSALAEAERICDTLYEQYNIKRSDDQLSKNVEEKLEDLNKTITTLQKSVQAL